MKLEDYNKFYHIDLSNQINNKWNEDSVLGIVKGSRKYSIKIRGKDKIMLKDKFISKDNSRTSKRHNRRVIVIIYCYLLYKALEDFNESKPLLLCRDVRPEILVINYLRKICKFKNNYGPLNREIKFRKRIEFNTKEKLPDSLAGNYVRKVYRGTIEANKIINQQELEELIDITSKII